MSGIYLSHFFRIHPVNPFLVFGVMWALIFGGIGIYTYRPMPWHTRRGDKILGMVARALSSGLAAFSGWVAFGYLWVIDWNNSRWDHLIVAAIAFLGIAGFLPQALFTSSFFRDAQAQSARPQPGRASGPGEDTLDARARPRENQTGS